MDISKFINLSIDVSICAVENIIYLHMAKSEGIVFCNTNLNHGKIH